MDDNKIKICKLPGSLDIYIFNIKNYIYTWTTFNPKKYFERKHWLVVKTLEQTWEFEKLYFLYCAKENIISAWEIQSGLYRLRTQQGCKTLSLKETPVRI